MLGGLSSVVLLKGRLVHQGGVGKLENVIGCLHAAVGENWPEVQFIRKQILVHRIFKKGFTNWF